jgi:hypothetical protein
MRSARSGESSYEVDAPKRAVRRWALVRVLAVVSMTGTGVMLARRAHAKLSMDDVAYQPDPKGSARCELCRHYVALPGKTAVRGLCGIVSGIVSPHGWCRLFAAGPVLEDHSP